jgi:hypothetical protein
MTKKERIIINSKLDNLRIFLISARRTNLDKNEQATHRYIDKAELVYFQLKDLASNK